MLKVIGGDSAGLDCAHRLPGVLLGRQPCLLQLLLKRTNSLRQRR